MTPRKRRDAEEPTPQADASDERVKDFLVQLVGEHARDLIDPADPLDEPYFEWLAREAREAQTPAERAETAREAEAFAQEVLRRMAERDAAERSPAAADTRMPDDAVDAQPAGVVRCVASAPRQRRPAVAAHGHQAVREAARAGCAPRVALGVAAGAGRDLWDEPVEAWVAIPPDVPPGQHVALHVSGDSMTPLLHDGDTLLVRLGAEVMVGDVIVARRPDDGYVVKRVAGITRETLELASENAEYARISIPHDRSLIVGVVVLRWCTHGSAAA